MRTFRCLDCPPGAAEHTASARGPLPVRCPAHKARRAAQQERRRRSSLRVVAPGETPPPPPALPEPSTRTPTPIQDALSSDLDAIVSSHPMAGTLGAIAEALATALDHPLTGVLEPRDLAALGRELRATLHELTSHEEEGRDDLFGDAAAPVVVPASS